MESDLVLVTRVVMLSDEQAFTQLMRKYQRPVRRYFLVQTGGDEMLSDDMAQETFIRAWQHLDTFRGLSGFGTWLYRIAHNTWCNRVARQHATLSLDDPAVMAVVDHVSDDVPAISYDEATALRRAISRLPEGERTCISLYYLQEQSIREIHTITGWPADTIKSHLARGRNHLKQILSNEIR